MTLVTEFSVRLLLKVKVPGLVPGLRIAPGLPMTSPITAPLPESVWPPPSTKPPLKAETSSNAFAATAMLGVSASEALVETASLPAEIVVGPVHVSGARSTSVPALLLVSEPAPVMMFVNVSWTLQSMVTPGARLVIGELTVRALPMARIMPPLTLIALFT